MNTLSESVTTPATTRYRRPEGSDSKQISTRSGCQPLPAGVVKSAGRTLQILELFDDLGRQASAIEVSNLLGYPKSSTSVLLRSLTTLGYLEFDRWQRLYRPTHRVSLLGDRVTPSLLGEPRLLRAARAHAEETGHTIFLTVRSGIHVLCIYVARGEHILDCGLARGVRRPLVGTASGYALLSAMPDHEVAKIVRRANAERKIGKQAATIGQILQIVRDTRRCNFALVDNSCRTGVQAAVLAITAPKSLSASPLAIGLIADRDLLAKDPDRQVKLLHDIVLTSGRA